MKLAQISIGVIAALVLSACTTLVEKGDKLYGQGMYQQAAEFYEKALAEDPDDVEAKQRLAETRSKIIDRGLIEVRMLRLGANYRGAASKLETLLASQNQWHVETMGAQAATQREEVLAVEGWLKTEAKQLAGLSQPDPFKWFEYEYRNLIANAQLSGEFAKYRDTLNKAGKQQCLALAKQVQGQRFYLHELTQRYCSLWQQPVSLQLDKSDRSRFTGLNIIKRERFKTPHDQAHRYAFNNTEAELEQAFQSSPWFSNKGAEKLPLTLDGKVQYRKQTVYRQVEKRYVVTELRPDPKDANNKLETDIEKVFAYQLKEHQESYSVNVSYSATLLGLRLANSGSGSYDNLTRSHDIEFAEADVVPLSADYLDQTQKFEQHLTQLSAEFKGDLNKLWQQQYCSTVNQAFIAEQALRCAQVKPDNDFVNRWFKQTFGVDYKAMQVLYGI